MLLFRHSSANTKDCQSLVLEKHYPAPTGVCTENAQSLNNSPLTALRVATVALATALNRQFHCLRIGPRGQ
jgi:hypothetical protein